jgi:aminopeptidase N
MSANGRNVLPANPSPVHYDLHITPDTSAWTFEGKVRITLDFTGPAKEVVCNGNDLKVIEAAIVTDSGRTPVTDISYDEVDKRIHFKLASEVSSLAILEIAYSGVIGEKLCGYYKAKHSGGGFLGTTQFEATDARRALPCWDEPNRKATFQVTMVVDEKETVLSNTSEEKRTVENGKAVVTFKKTPVMSTYLLAWTHGELNYIEQTGHKVHGKEPTVVRVYTAGITKASEKGTFALEVAVRCLELYEKFFGSDYILDKCDLIAIPNFAAGAMENWGLITYRETALLCDESSSSGDTAYVALVVAHELAHQWFGNLVTMDWWRELWLNEAFATWVEYWVVDELYPEMNVWTRFVLQDSVAAFDLDAMLSSHPIEVEIRNAEQVDDIFDAISYSKGCCILRMIIDYIGLNAFQTGVSKYLREFQFRNATTVDLWRHLGAAAGQDNLDSILANWTGEQGYPYLKAGLSADGKKLEIEQYRFLASGDCSTPSHWRVPLAVAIGTGKGDTFDVKKIIVEPGKTLIDLPEGTQWVRVNKDGSTFCRVKHEDNLNVAKAIAHLSTLDRMSLASDQRALSLAGLIHGGDALRCLQAWFNEDDSAVVKAVVSLEVSLRRLVPNGDKAAEDAYNAVVRKLYGAFVAKHSLSAKSSDSGVLAEVRGQVLRRLVKAGDEAAIKTCQSLWDKRDSAAIAPDLRQAVYSSMCESHGRPVYDALKAMHAQSSANVTEGRRLLRAMRATEDQALLREAADFAISDQVRSQDCLDILAGLPLTVAGASIFVDVVTTRWAMLWAKMPPMLYGRMLQSADEIEDEALLNRLEAFVNGVDAQQLSAIERSFKQGVESARNSIRT